MHKRNTHILLSEIQYESTCVSLSFPHHLTCSNCESTLDLLIRTYGSKNRERHKYDWRKCQQYWDSSWTCGNHATQGNIKKQQLVRSYLQVKREVVIDYINCYRQTKKKTRTNNVDSNIQGEKVLLIWSIATLVFQSHKKDRNKWVVPVYHQKTVSSHYKTSCLRYILGSTGMSPWSC